MILVDIYVPSVDAVYDFQLDENTPVRAVTTEIGEMLGKKFKVPMQPGAQRFVLCSFEQKAILPGEKTLFMCGIRNGSRLLLL